MSIFRIGEGIKRAGSLSFLSNYLIDCVCILGLEDGGDIFVRTTHHYEVEDLTVHSLYCENLKPRH
jgi:hypothetical protein